LCAGTDEDILAERMHFVLAPDGETIATTSAWSAQAVGRASHPLPGGPLFFIRKERKIHDLLQ
jgi:hypothetical protein